uniref:Uncharacterized protein n=1 Tax=Triticum urartu TaxID=4572 RepID=A0A8R7U7S8_TRIUA
MQARRHCWSFPTRSDCWSRDMRRLPQARQDEIVVVLGGGVQHPLSPSAFADQQK